MLIEFHVLQHHAVANLNRDDTGQPKTAWINGTLRGRVSSQSKKRSLRRPGRAGDGGGSGPFAEVIGPDRLGLRTKLFPERVGEELRKRVETGTLQMEEGQIRSVVIACQSIAQKETKEKDDEKGKQDGKARTGQLIFLHPSEVSDYVSRLLAQRDERSESFDYFLNPATIFGELVRKEAEQRAMESAALETLAKNAWLILKARWDRLFPKGDDDEAEVPPADPTAENAVKLVERVVDLSQQDEQFLTELCKALKVPTGKNVDPAEKERIKTEKMAEDAILAEAKSTAPKDYSKFKAALLPAGRAETTAADIALFGRMTTSDAFEDVEAACRVAHGFSTHEIQVENDYWTVIDDLGGGNAFAYSDTTHHASAVYYFHFAIDFDALVANLFGRESGKRLAEIEKEIAQDEASQQRFAKARVEAGRTVRAFVKALAETTPTGKRNSHAADQRPGFILAEVKLRHVPTSYANAFLEPAREGSEKGVNATRMTDSIRKLCRLAAHQRRVYEIETTPLVFLGEPDGEPFIEVPVSRDPKAGTQPVGAVCEKCSDLTKGVLRVTGFDAADIEAIFTDPAPEGVPS